MTKPDRPGYAIAPAGAALKSVKRAPALAQFRQELKAARAALARHTDALRAPSGQVATPAGEVRVGVRGEGYPTLIVHGAVGGFDRALEIGAQLLGSGYQIIAPSRYGYPGSPIPPAASPGSQASAFVTLLDHLDISQVAVIALSAGGPSAVQLALRVPDRIAALVLVATTITEQNLRLPSRLLLRTVVSSDFLFWLLMGPLHKPGRHLLIPQDYKLDAYQTGELRDVMGGFLPIRPRRAGVLFDMYVTNPDPIRHPDAYPLEELDVPTLFLNARDDPLIDYQRAHDMADRVPRARFTTVPSGGHAMLGHGGLLRAEIDQFVQAWV